MTKIKQLSALLLATIFLTLNSCNPKEEIKTWDSACEGEYLKLDESKTLTKIVFGSCASQIGPVPLFNTAANQKPDLFIFMGDNIYADTEDTEVRRGKYLQQCAKAEFVKLKMAAPFMAVWDDHDYGYNDVGAEYKFKVESKKDFMEFWGETKNVNRMSHPGIYDSKIIGEVGKRVQIILLDTRYFRTGVNYVENFDTEATVLGAEQWAWLETELQKPAEIRLIVSSIQFCTEFNGMEAWANFPLEQEKMFNLIASTNASGVLFISGDVHYSELSKREPTNTYPIYDLTSSGMTGVSNPVDNIYRVGTASNINNVGKMDINWAGSNTTIKYSILDVNATELLTKTVTLSEISF